MKSLLLSAVLALVNPPEYRVFYAHPPSAARPAGAWEHLGAWDSLRAVPREWIGRREFVVIREQRVQ